MCMRLHTTIWQSGRTPLYYASQNGHIFVIKELLASGADMKVADMVSELACLVCLAPALAYTHSGATTVL